MKDLTENPGLTPPPDWLPDHLRQYWRGVAPKSTWIAGDYIASQLAWLQSHVNDMERARASFVIAPMGSKGGVGTYRTGTKKAAK